MRLCTVCGFLWALSASAFAEEEVFVPLFDGKTLAGWEGNEKVFRIEDGAVVAGSLKQPIAHNEFLCTTREYGDFELRLQAKLIGAGDNAGIQFRSKRVPNHHEVSGYQCDMGTASDRIVWGGLYDESRRNKMLVEGDQAKIKEIFKRGSHCDKNFRLSCFTADSLGNCDFCVAFVVGITIEFTNREPRLQIWPH